MEAKRFLLVKQSSDDTNIGLPAASTIGGLGVGAYNTHRYFKTLGDYKNKDNLPENLKSNAKFNRANKWLAIGGLGFGLYNGVKTLNNFSNKTKNFEGIV